MSKQPVSPQDYFALMQKMANPGGQAFQNLFFPALDAKEIDKKIAELKSVEMWLNANLGMLQMSIQTLEFQKALLTTDGSAKFSGSGGINAEAQSATNPAMWAWQMMNQAGEQFQAATRDAMKPVPMKKQAAARKR